MVYSVDKQVTVDYIQGMMGCMMPQGFCRVRKLMVEACKGKRMTVVVVLDKQDFEDYILEMMDYTKA